jgi:hypothetical protein
MALDRALHKPVEDQTSPDSAGAQCKPWMRAGRRHSVNLTNQHCQTSRAGRGSLDAACVTGSSTVRMRPETLRGTMASCVRSWATILVFVGVAGCQHEPAATNAHPRRDLRLLDVAVPKLLGRVTDDALLLTEEESAALETKLAEHERATGNQFALLTIRELPGVDIGSFGFTVASRWRLGRAHHDDGLLMTIAQASRKIDIQVGTGLERAIPDELAARVIKEQLVPAFRSQEFAAGIDEAFQTLIDAAKTTKPR